MIAFFIKQQDKLLEALFRHLEIVGLVLLISIILAFLLTILILPRKSLSNIVIQIFNIIYSIPSLALFAILIPFLGIGMKTAVFVLVLYNQYILIRSNVEALNSVDASVLEAAQGMGMSRWQILWKIRIPLAVPRMMGGIHLAVISTIGITTIAATINAGGLGKILFDGLRTMNIYKILWGTIFSAGIALAADFILRLVEALLRRWLTPNEQNEAGLH